MNDSSLKGKKKKKEILGDGGGRRGPWGRMS